MRPSIGLPWTSSAYTSSEKASSGRATAGGSLSRPLINRTPCQRRSVRKRSCMSEAAMPPTKTLSDWPLATLSAKSIVSAIVGYSNEKSVVI